MKPRIETIEALFDNETGEWVENLLEGMAKEKHPKIANQLEIENVVFENGEVNGSVMLPALCCCCPDECIDEIVLTKEELVKKAKESLSS